jgi:hypothetical protein
MHVLIKVKSPNNISRWQMGFNSAFKGLTACLCVEVSSEQRCCDTTKNVTVLHVLGLIKTSVFMSMHSVG